MNDPEGKGPSGKDSGAPPPTGESKDSAAKGSIPAARTEPKVEVYGQGPPARAMVGYIKPTLWVVGAVYVVALLLLNTEPAHINFVFFKAEVPLVVALVVVLALGFGLGALTVWLRGRHHKAAP